MSGGEKCGKRRRSSSASSGLGSAMRPYLQGSARSVGQLLAVPVCLLGSRRLNAARVGVLKGVLLKVGC